MMQLNIDYILKATITNAIIERKKDSNGKESYDGELAYSLSIVATEDGSVIHTEQNLVTSALKATAQEAEKDLLNIS